MMRFDWKQAELLCERYWEIWWGELGTLVVLVGQAPVIAGLIVTAWKDSKESATLHLFLCLAALWVGCMNSCREIVKELPLYRRERRVGLSIGAYLFSKLWVLGLLDLVAAALLVGIVNYWVGLSGSKLLLTLVLWLTSLTGTALGLLISAVCATSDRAVGLVPLAVLPQILFSKAFLPEAHAVGMARTLESLTLLGWSFDLYGYVRMLGSDARWLDMFRSLGALSGLGVLLVLSTVLVMALDDL